MPPTLPLNNSSATHSPCGTGPRVLTMKTLRTALLLPAALLLAACGTSSESPLLGTLEWDRVSLPAEASEPVLRLAVAEGARVKAGDLLVDLDGRRMAARIAQAEAQLLEQQGRLSELDHGARSEEIDAARANLASAIAGRLEAVKQDARQAELAKKQLVPAPMPTLRVPPVTVARPTSPRRRLVCLSSPAARDPSRSSRDGPRWLRRKQRSTNCASPRHT